MFSAVRAQLQQFNLVSHTAGLGAKIHSVASTNFNTHVSSYIFTKQVGVAAILQTYIRFETQPRYIPPSAKFQWSLSASPGKYWDCTTIKPRQLPVQSFISSSSHNDTTLCRLRYEQRPKIKKIYGRFVKFLIYSFFFVTYPCCAQINKCIQNSSITHKTVNIFVNCNWVDTRWQQYSTH